VLFVVYPLRLVLGPFFAASTPLLTDSNRPLFEEPSDGGQFDEYSDYGSYGEQDGDGGYEAYKTLHPRGAVSS
jgi:hypothetical protein